MTQNLEERKRARKRRLKIKALIEEIGLWNIDQSSLAKEYKISEPMISKDIKYIVKHWLKDDDIDDVKINLSNGYRKAIRECMTIMLSGNKSEKLNAIKTFKVISDGFSDFLEKFGLKPKVADKLDIHGQIKELSLEEEFKEYKKFVNKKK